MNISVNSLDMREIQERVIKTDEVIRLLDVKKKEVNKLDKKYKKILEKFCTKNKELSDLNSSWEKKYGDLLLQNEKLVKSQNEYINDAEKKYQSACQEIQTLNEKCENLKKKIEKFDHKDKVKNTKKLQDALKEAKEQYSHLENTSNKTISDLKEKNQNLEQLQNKTLKQLTKLRLEYDNLKKSQDDSLTLRNEIEELETKLESSEIEFDILKQAHETDITDLKKQYENENKLLKDKIETYKNELFKQKNEENNTVENQYRNQSKLIQDNIEKLTNHITELTKTHKDEKEEYIIDIKLLIQQLEELNTQVNKKRNGTIVDQTDENKVVELTKKHENEKRVLEEQLEELNTQVNKKRNGTIVDQTDENKVVELTKKHENEKRVLEEHLEELRRKINEKTSSNQETSTQTDDEDIYNLEDILTEIHDMPPLISPLSVTENEEINRKSSCSVAVGSDNIIPTFTDSFTDNCIYDFLALANASTQTDFYENTIKVKSFNTTDIIKSNNSVVTEKDEILLIDSSTQTIDAINNHQSEIEFKFQSSVVKIPKNNVLEKIPKNVLLKSRVTKKYKNTNNSKLFNSLKNSKLNLKFLVEKYIDTNSKFIFVSPSILKSDKNKMSDTHNFTENTNYNFPVYNSAQFSNRENIIPCSCQLGMCWNRFVSMYPCNYSRIMCCNNNPNNYYKMRNSKSNHFGDIVNSNCEEDDRLRTVLKKYKHNLIKKYVTDKYVLKHTKMKKKLVLDDSEDDDLLNFLENVMNDQRKSSKKRDTLKHKSTSFKPITLDSDSEEEIDTIFCSPNKMNSVRKNAKVNAKIDRIKSSDIPSFDLQESLLQEKEQNDGLQYNQETNNSCLEFSNTSNIHNNNENVEKSNNLDRISNRSSEQEEVNKKDNKIKSTNMENLSEKNFGKLEENHTNLFTLSKRQRLLLRKTTMLKGNKLINSNCKKTSRKSVISHSNIETCKRKMFDRAQPDYKKQKLELFGINSDSDSSREDECKEIQKSDNINLVQNKFDKSNQNILTDNSYTPNISSGTANKKVVKSGINILLSNSKKQINSSCDENLVTSLATNKIFKKPERNKFNLPSCNVMKNEKKCQVISTNVKDLSDTELVEDITSNIIEKSLSTETQKELQPINLDKAKKLISNIATNDWDKELLITASNYLANKDPAIVGRLIVDEAAKDFSQKFDKTFTPPAPLLTTTQQKILVLLDNLEKLNLRNIYTTFLQVLERRLLLETRLEVVHSLTRLYVTACKLKYDIEKIRMFCCNSAYYMGDLLLPVMFIVLTTWGDVLPMAENAEDIPLATAIVQVIQSKTCKEPGYNCFNLNRLLKDYYGYKLSDQSNEEIMNKFINIYSATYSNTAYTAIVILCKNLPNKWTYTQIKNNLLPLINNSENNENKMRIVSLIQRLIDKFERADYIIEIKNDLSNFMINTHSGAIPPGSS